MRDVTKTSRARPENFERDFDRSLRFLEELGWLLRSYPDLNLSALTAMRAELAALRHLPRLPVGHLAPEKSSVVYLVGTLPSLFMDEMLFPQNEDIADFAKETLRVSMTRWQKKSRFEIIGQIVCTAISLSAAEISDLVDAIDRVVSDDSAKQVVRRRKESGLSWNEVIQMINREQ